MCCFMTFFIVLSKEDIYTSKVKYILKRGKPYIWVPEKELHNVVGFSLCCCFVIHICSKSLSLNVFLIHNLELFLSHLALFQFLTEIETLWSGLHDNIMQRLVLWYENRNLNINCSYSLKYNLTHLVCMRCEMPCTYSRIK